MYNLNKIRTTLFVTSLLLLLLPSLCYGLSPSFVHDEEDGTSYKLFAEYSSSYVNGTLYDITVGIEAVSFGTLEGVIIGFYDIEVYISIIADEYMVDETIPLPDIYTIGGSSSTNQAYNLSGVDDDSFQLAASFQFKGNNTQGEDPTYSFIWIIGFIKVKEASFGLIIPVLAVVSLVYIVGKRRKK